MPQGCTLGPFDFPHLINDVPARVANEQKIKVLSDELNEAYFAKLFTCLFCLCKLNSYFFTF